MMLARRCRKYRADLSNFWASTKWHNPRPRTPPRSPSRPGASASASRTAATTRTSAGPVIDSRAAR